MPRLIDSPANPKSLGPMLARLHAKTAAWINRLDDQPGRQVWHNFWDTLLSYESSYLARLNYVHQNAVRHGLVPVANQYPFCSAGWFESTAALYAFKIDRISVRDECEPIWNSEN
jgi:REP-associated tyrosine transposase